MRFRILRSQVAKEIAPHAPPVPPSIAPPHPANDEDDGEGTNGENGHSHSDRSDSQNEQVEQKVACSGPACINLNIKRELSRLSGLMETANREITYLDGALERWMSGNLKKKYLLLRMNCIFDNLEETHHCAETIFNHAELHPADGLSSCPFRSILDRVDSDFQKLVPYEHHIKQNDFEGLITKISTGSGMASSRSS